ncbi:MFS transporter [Rhodoferax lacus]|uniref:MFS transporter n=1 Tax=Rhodoferax lacus TaxID=2184758 RepID=A0A3E1RFK9_9BURK|nr:MFS transporter [Rhodoferax lacus]RFO97812.1 MFS transporter [Rhodoferax lacus]
MPDSQPLPPTADSASAHATPGVLQFATIAGLEALVRGSTLAVFPLLMYRAWGDAQVVSELYFVVGVLSLLTALGVPLLAQRLQRRWVYCGGLCLYVLSAAFGMLGGKWMAVALLCNTMAAATSFVCFNAYVLDHVAKTEFARLESLRMFYGGLGWVLGPALGVQLLPLWHGSPFLMAGLGASAILFYIWKIRLGNGRVMLRQARGAAHPWVYLRRFFRQPRLIGGWLFAVMRSCGWWFYFVYVGIFAVEHGLGDNVGGIATSLANMGLFAAPLLFHWVRRHSLRRAMRTGFLLGGVCFILATLLSPLPWATIGVLLLGSYCLVLLDVCAGLPFLMSVKPSERTEMSAVYSSFRDVSGILSPGLAWLVLQFAGVSAVFAAGGCALLLAWIIAGQLHPQLGVPGTQRVRAGRPGQGG